MLRWKSIIHILKKIILYSPAMTQLAIFFVGYDIYPFSKNEMYAGHPDPNNFQVTYLIGIKNGKEFISPEDFQEETFTPLISSELEKASPDFSTVCNLIWGDRKKKLIMDAVRIEQRHWETVSDSNVTKPDSVKVLHECKYR